METNDNVTNFRRKNLKGFSYMQVPIIELLRGRILREARGEKTAAWLHLICAGFHEEPPGSLPNNERWLADAAGLYEDEWAAIRDAVMRDWHLDQEGRWRTPILDRMVEAGMLRKRGCGNGGNARAEQKAAA